MSKFLRFPLNLQLFSEPGEPGGGAVHTDPVPVQTPPIQPAIDYGKIEEIVTKRSATSADSALKGYLKEQGLSGEDLDKAVASFKDQKEQERIAKEQKEGTLETENAQLKQQILNGKIDTKLTALAAAEGVTTEKLPFLLKLIERKDLADDKGEVVEDKVKEALTTVLTAFPDFKGNVQQGSGFQQIGAAAGTGGKGTGDASAAAFQNGRIVLPSKK